MSKEKKQCRSCEAPAEEGQETCAKCKQDEKEIKDAMKEVT